MRIVQVKHKPTYKVKCCSLYVLFESFFAVLNMIKDILLNYMLQ